MIPKSIQSIEFKALVEKVEVSLERSHRISTVRNNSSKLLQSRYRSGNLVRSEESKDSKHGKTSIIDLSLQSTSLSILGLILVESKWIVKVKNKVDIVTEGLCRGVLSRLSGSSVMISRSISSSTGLIEDFEECDDSENLPLGSCGDHVPLLFGGEVGGWAGGSVHVLCPGEDEVGLDAVSYESEHGNATVFDFGVTEEADGSFISHSVEVSIRQFEANDDMMR
jgi:hypothetical protein